MNVSTAGSITDYYIDSSTATTWVNYPITFGWPQEKSKDQLEGEDFKRLIMYQGLKILNIQLENGQIIINCKLGKNKFKIRINGNLSLEDLKGKIMDEIFKPLEYVPIIPTVTPTITYPWIYDDKTTGGSAWYYDTYTTGGTI